MNKQQVFDAYYINKESVAAISYQAGGLHYMSPARAWWRGERAEPLARQSPQKRLAAPRTRALCAPLT